MRLPIKKARSFDLLSFIVKFVFARRQQDDLISSWSQTATRHLNLLMSIAISSVILIPNDRTSKIISFDFKQ